MTERMLRIKGKPPKHVASPQPSPEITFPPVIHQEFSFSEHMDRLKERQRENALLTRSAEYATILIKSQKPIGLVLSSDWHIGAMGTNYELLEEHLNLVTQNPNVILAALSNTIDGYIWPGGIWSEVAHIEEQVEIATSAGKMLKDSLVAVVGSRCHDWTKDKGGISPQEIAFRDNVDSGMPFFPNGGMLTLKINDFDYRVAMQHKSRFNSSLNVTNAAKRALDLRWPSADVVAQAHNHTKAIEHAVRWEGPDRRDVVLVRTGAYKIDDGYSKSEGFGAGQEGSPMVIFMADRKKVIPFLNIEDGINFMLK